jgi:mRNA-degrading endonuclease HigB of HigAB toxin-antitoxin module
VGLAVLRLEGNDCRVVAQLALDTGVFVVQGVGTHAELET